MKPSDMNNGKAAAGQYKTICLLIGVLILAMGCYFAYNQRLKNAAKPSALFSLEWFLKPVEWNAYRRIPGVGATAMDVHRHMDETGIWAAADTTLTFSDDLGKSWRAMKTPGDAAVNGVSFVDFKRGWAASEGGGVWKTEDGGATWIKREVGGGAVIRSLYFKSRKHGLATGEDTLLWETSNGGDSWQKQAYASAEAPESLYPVAEKTGYANHTNAEDDFAAIDWGWAAAGDGTVIYTEDGGAVWTEYKYALEVWETLRNSLNCDGIYDVKFLNPRFGFVVGATGAFMIGADGSGKWKRFVRPDNGPMSSAFFYTDRIGWSVGGKGLLMKTETGGQNWQILPARFFDDTISKLELPPPDLVKAYFINSREGFAASEHTIFQTTDKGRTWHRIYDETESVIESFSADADGKGLVLVSRSVENGRKVYYASKFLKGRVNESLPALDMYESLKVEEGAAGSVIILDKNSGLATLGDRSLWTLKTDLTDRDFVFAKTPADIKLSSVEYYNKGKRALIGVTERNQIVISRDEGNNWKKVKEFKARGGLRWAGLTKNNHFRALDSFGNFYEMDPDDQRWTQKSTYRKLPAPWFYFFLTIPGFLFYLGLSRTKNKEIRPIKGEDDGTSAEKDGAGRDRAFGELSEVIKKSESAVVALTGEWGSVANSRVKNYINNLKKSGYPPVWFNAYRHRNAERGVFSALVDRVSAEATPKFFSREGLLFRRRLFWSRVFKKWPGAILFLAIFFISMGYLIEISPDISFSKAADEILALYKTIKDGDADFRALFSGKLFFPALALWGMAASLSAFVFSFAAFDGGLIRRVVKIFRSKKKSSLRGEPAFYGGFAEDFSLATEAVAPGKVVIFIDDLDRCAPGDALDILEGVKFLMASGKCVAAVPFNQGGLEKKLSEAFYDLGVVDLGETVVELENSITVFCKRYLQKLIDVEISTAEGIVANNAEDKKTAGSVRAGLCSKSLKYWGVVAAVFCCFLFFLAGKEIVSHASFNSGKILTDLPKEDATSDGEIKEY